MTIAQHKFYWRRWAAVARHNSWWMSARRLFEGAFESADVSPHHRAVWAAARDLAMAASRGLTADDLRHGCHIVALGADKRSRDLTNSDFDSLLTYWGDGKTIRGLLFDATDMGSEIHRANPALQRRRRYLYALRVDCLQGYLVSECSRIYGTKKWEDLNDVQLEEFHHHMRGRPGGLKLPPQPSPP